MGGGESKAEIDHTFNDFQLLTLSLEFEQLTGGKSSKKGPQKEIENAS